MKFHVRNPRIFVRRCWRRLGFLAPMVVWPQAVPYYGAVEFGDVGKADCTACGGRHLLLGGLRGLSD